MLLWTRQQKGKWNTHEGASMGVTELLVLSTIIGLIALVIYKARSLKAAQTPFPMKWFCFYTYFLLPFWSLSILAQIPTAGTVSALPTWYFAYILGIMALIVAVFIGLHKRRLWGWHLNFVLLTAKTLSYPLGVADAVQDTNENQIIVFVVGLVIFGLLFTLPHVVYFTKRRVLFT
jgi:hypothetical protein